MTKIDWTKNRIAWGLLTEEEQADFSAAPGDVIFYAGSDCWDRTELDVDFDTDVYRKIPPAKTKPRVPWGALSDDVVAVARDQDGFCFAFTKKAPRLQIHAGVWLVAQPQSEANPLSAKFFRDFDPGTCDWTDSLVLRPGYGEPDA